MAVTAKHYGYPEDLVTDGKATDKTSGPSQPAGRLKGKARKLAKATAGAKIPESADDVPTQSRPTYAIKVKDFINLAQYITGKRKARVPQVFIQSLTRAIALRREHGMYSQRQGGQSNSGKSHSHFLGILEYTLEILKPHASSADDQPGVNREKIPGKDQSEEFENRFSKLELQEPSDRFQQFLDAPDIDRAIRTEVKIDPRYEADLAKDQKEEYAAAYFFSQDIMNFFAFAQGAWKGYKDGRDLAAASVSVSTTIALVRDLEEQLQAQFPVKVDYLDKVELFYLNQCCGQTVSQGFREDVKAYELADDVMLTTYLLICNLRGDGYAGCLQHPESRNESVPWFKSLPMRNPWIIGLVFGRLTPSWISFPGAQKSQECPRMSWYVGYERWDLGNPFLRGLSLPSIFS